MGSAVWRMWLDWDWVGVGWHRESGAAGNAVEGGGESDGEWLCASLVTTAGDGVVLGVPTSDNSGAKARAMPSRPAVRKRDPPSPPFQFHQRAAVVPQTQPSRSTLTSQLHSHPTSNVPSTSSPRGRYAVFSGGELQLWEPISEDRTVVPKGPEMSLTDSFGMLEDTEGAAGEAKEEGAAGLPVDALEQFERFHVVSHVLPVLIGTLLGQ